MTSRGKGFYNSQFAASQPGGVGLSATGISGQIAFFTGINSIGPAEPGGGFISWSGNTITISKAGANTIVSSTGLILTGSGSASISLATTVSFTGNLVATGKFTTYNNEATAGVGSSYIRGVTRRTETGADSNVLTVTPPAASGTYRITIVMSVSAATAATLGWTATWTDANGTAQAPTNLALTTNGVAGTTLTVTAAAATTYYGEVIVDVNAGGVAIVVKTTFTGTSIAYVVSAIIERLN